MALTEACKEALWVMSFMVEINEISGQAEPGRPIVIFAHN